MERNENKTNYSVKSKLVAAIAMLLVATIMVVSSTYAWFTLSTKPEVTGISTAVGANGALEMLLATKNGSDWFYGTGNVSDKSTTERNTYWGNLVNLSDNNTYGTDKITLYPSQLTLNGGKLQLAAPLSTPVYGSDGRVEGVDDNALFAAYNIDKAKFYDANGAGYGFRAIGVASGLTDRQKAFRDAISAIATARYNAQTEARKSLSANGTTLANIAVKKAMVGETATYSQTEIDAINAMINGLETSLEYAEEAYIQAIYAIVASQLSNLEDTYALTAIAAIKSAVSTAEEGLGKKVAAAITAANIENITNSLTGYSIFTQAVGSLNSAQGSEITASGEDGAYLWSDFNIVLYYLVDVDKITVNGFEVDEISEHTGDIVSAALGGDGVNVRIPTGGGVYADIADLCGDYSVDIIIESGKLGMGVDAGDIPANMIADSTQATPYITQIVNYVNVDDYKPNAAAAGELPMTEFYGYTIDLAFRTNASNSDLLLQTTPADRIYSDNQNEATMGNGSTMTFKSSDTNFTETQVKELMKHLRVVFYDTTATDGFATIYATAKLDLSDDAVTVDANGVTANLRIYTTENGEDTFVDEDENAVITSLDTNVAKHISVLVYLDGETIKNADVAATAAAAQSMTGSLNLQFASSAELVPMEYGDLHQAATNTNNNTDDTTGDDTTE